MKLAVLCRAFVLLILIGSCPGVSASGTPTPMELPGGRIVNLQESRKLIAAGAYVIDVRSAVNFGRGHIPGAVMASYKGESANTIDFEPTRDRFSLSVLPDNTAADILIYSHGMTGWKSYKAAITAIRSGYTRVHWFRSGLESWTAADLPLER